MSEDKPEININVITEPIVGTPRKLRARWTAVERPTLRYEDLIAVLGVEDYRERQDRLGIKLPWFTTADCERQLAEQLYKEISKELDEDE